ncbi:MAG: hypothetical protein GWN14_18755 [candidate division Zixibacteria bacterium]|nr:hypothetical protein [candidate division Zixibacteria bacterium]NIW40752.1 hypothetical protein [candidate division Zixibacteria bacterium]NIX57904.1 hypothetical protein [candidate division Zixibacteria bacterium]
MIPGLLVLKEGIPSVLAGFGSIERHFFLLFHVGESVLEILAEIGLFFVAHPFCLRLKALMIRFFVIKTAVKTALERSAALGALILTSNLFRYLYFFFTAPAIDSI